MKIVKQLSVVTSILALAIGANVSQAADTAPAPLKVAVVNVQQILQQSPRVAELSKKLESQFKGRQTKINDEQKSLQARVDKFNKDAATLSEKNRTSIEKDITNDRAALVKEVVAYQQDLQKEQTKIMQGLLSDLNKTVSGIAKSQSFALVLDAQAVIFAADGKDITKDVADKFNK